ncbi:MAG TPA: nuclear transport factor 2 family protein [Candidatus Binataceae bacterium]|nr:nuclear transport factor 2 family protein [Candidatus Binataceae bacterium]
MKPWERFLEKYVAFGQKPSRESHARLFAPDAVIFHPGMPAPMPASHYVDFIVAGLRRLADFHLIPTHWAVNGDTIFVEARNTAIVNRRPVVWPATYVVTLREEMVVRGHAHYDRTELLAHFEPELANNVPNPHTLLLEGAAAYGGAVDDDPAYAASVHEKIVAPYIENGLRPDPQRFKQFYAPEAQMINPGFERPLRRDELAGYYTSLTHQIEGLQLHLERWAVSRGLLFMQWTVTGKIAGQQLRLANADRFTLDSNLLATEGVAYFDNLMLRAMLEPALARFRNVSFADVRTAA